MVCVLPAPTIAQISQWGLAVAPDGEAGQQLQPGAVGVTTLGGAIVTRQGRDQRLPARRGSVELASWPAR